MKRIIAAVLLLAASFTGAFILNYMTIKKINKVSDKLEIIAEAADNASAQELLIMTDDLIYEWKRNDWMVHATINKDTLIDAEKSIEMLPYLAKAELKDDFKIYCIEAYGKINSIGKSEKINSENIF